MKSFGVVERIKFRLTATETSYDCYVTFQSSDSADKACQSLQDHCINDSIIKTSLYNIDNLCIDQHDFVPKEKPKINVTPKKSPPPYMAHCCL